MYIPEGNRASTSRRHQKLEASIPVTGAKFAGAKQRGLTAAVSL